MEIERKFLIPVLPDDLDRYPSAAIDQGYLASTPHGVEVRVRRKGADLFLTVKHGPSLSRIEVELPLSAAQFDELWPLTAGRQLRKTRYDLPGPDGLTIEIDVYGGALHGLRTADVEFPDEEAAHAFQPPGFFGPEITGHPEYRNEKMARDGLPAGGWKIQDSRSKIQTRSKIQNG